MTRYHYQQGVTQEKKKSHWFLGFVLLLILAAVLYGLAVFLAPQFVRVPFTGLSADAVAKKVQNSKAGEFGDRLFIPQINVETAIREGGDVDMLSQGAWHRSADSGNPAKGGNFILSAHKFTLDVTPQWTRAKSPFYNLAKLNQDDPLVVDYHGNRYQYKVTKKYGVEAAGAVGEQKANDAKLTLYAVDHQGNAVAGPVIEAMLQNKPADKEPTTSFGNVLKAADASSD